jgi:hypothetical protein
MFLTNFDEVISELVPSEHQGNIVFLLGKIIRIVHEASPDRWGIRVSKHGTIMVLIGMHEVFQVLHWGVHFIFDYETIDLELRSDDRFFFSGIFDEAGEKVNTGVYLSNAGTESCDLEFEHAKELFLSQINSFQVVVARAAKTRTHPLTKKNHSPDFVQYLSKRTGQQLPQPSYVQVVEEAEYFSSPELMEGEAREYVGTRYERNPEARRQCLAHYGYRCQACDQSLEKIYGSIGRKIIHVHHHLDPISKSGGVHSVDPIRDLRPVCPNCHAVIHSVNPPYSIADIRKALNLGEEKSEA